MISDHAATTPGAAARYPASPYDPLMRLGWRAELTRPTGLTRRAELGSTVIILR